MANDGESFTKHSESNKSRNIFFTSNGTSLFAVLGFVTYAVLAERKVMGYMQLRHGPNQLGGRWGLLQTVADVLKLLLKEDTIPKLADRPLFILAPIIAFAPSFHGISGYPVYRQVSVCGYRSWLALLYCHFRNHDIGDCNRGMGIE